MKGSPEPPASTVERLEDDPDNGCRTDLATTTDATTTAATSTAAASTGSDIPLIVISLVMAGILVVSLYGGTLDNPFAYDCQQGILENPWVRALENIPRYFRDPRTLTTKYSNSDYRPVLQTTFALDYAISGFEPWSWRLTNHLLHIICSVSLFILGRQFFGSGRTRDLDWLSKPEGDLASAAAAILFAAHPFATGTVNYVWARSSLLVAALILPCTILYIRAMIDNRLKCAISFLILYALALCSKVEAISVLAVFFFLECFLRPNSAGTGSTVRDTTASGTGTRKATAHAAIVRLCMAFAVTLIYMMVRVKVMPPGAQEGVNLEALGLSRETYFLTQTRIWWLYISRLIVPLGLVIDDASYRPSHSIADPAFVHAVTGWCVVIWALLKMLRREPEISILGLSFFIHISPHSSLVPINQWHNEYRPYLACSSLFILLAVGLMRCVKCFTTTHTRPFCSLVLALLLIESTITMQQNRVWDGPLELWGHVVKVAPDSAKGQSNLGVALLDRGRVEEARLCFVEAIRLDKKFNAPWINLGLIQEREGAVESAGKSLDQAVDLAPDDVFAYLWRARFRDRIGDVEGARADFMKAHECDSHHPGVIVDWVDFLSRRGLNEEALGLAKSNLDVDPATLRERILRLGDP